MIKVAVVGASGYVGSDIIRILHNHNEVKINYIGANSNAGNSLSETMGQFSGLYDDVLCNLPLEEIARENDCIMTATPHGFLAKILDSKVMDNCVLIDLSADFRLKNPKKYEEYYKFTHPNDNLLKNAVYGLCELFRESIKKARLIANPGCYPTCSTLCIAPLLKAGIIDSASIIIDAKSGVSGAGRSASVDNLFCEVHENIKAYGLLYHRHTAEIEQNLSIVANKDIALSFTPHLIPMNRGILITAYANINSKYKNITQDELDNIYSEFYQGEYFIRFHKNAFPPQTKWVKGSNFADISICLDSKNKRVIMMGAIDNLIKGASGQAVQNLNICFGLKEQLGLENAPLFP